MLKREVLELITNGESSTVEFKRDDIRPEVLAKSFVALLNLKGGRVLLGIGDDGSVAGINRPNLQEWVMDTVFGHYVSPQVIPEYEEIVMDDGKRVAVVTVETGILKPYVLHNGDHEDIYIRAGNISKIATREQQIRLIETGGFLHVETLPVPGTSLEDLDKRRLAEYFIRKTGDEKAPQNDEEWISRLSNVDLLRKSQFGELHCTLAGILLFGNQPIRKYSYAGIRVLVFPGMDKDYNAIRDDWISRPIVEFNDYDAKDNAIPIEPNIVEQAISLIRGHISVEGLEGTALKRSWDYPPDAIRELLVNALAHRDYTKAVEIEVGVYSDRLEVISPGAPPNGQTKEKMLAGQRIARNPIIAEMMRDYGLGERRGMGIRRKIIPLMVQHNGVEPIFDITDDYVKVTLPKKA